MWCYADGWVVSDVLKNILPSSSRVERSGTTWSWSWKHQWFFKIPGTTCPVTQHHIAEHTNLQKQ
jgi:hypothetical protein